MRSVDGFNISNASASSALHQLQGGKYQLAAMATWSGGNIKVNQLGPDNSTLLDVPSSTLSANGALSIDLPPGSYQLTVTTATALYASLARVPLEG